MRCVGFLGHGQDPLSQAPSVVTFLLVFIDLLYRLYLFLPLAMRASSCPAPPHLDRPISNIRQIAHTAVDGATLFLNVDMPIKCRLLGWFMTGSIQIRLPFPKMPKYFLDQRRKEICVATGQESSYWAVHPLKLHSSYASVKGSTNTRDSVGEPLATSYHSKFLGTVDYLWYSDGLVPARVLDTLPIDVLRKTRGLPCHELGSDHLALVSEFFFEPNGWWNLKPA